MRRLDRGERRTRSLRHAQIGHQVGERLRGRDSRDEDDCVVRRELRLQHLAAVRREQVKLRTAERQHRHVRGGELSANGRADEAVTADDDDALRRCQAAVLVGQHGSGNSQGTYVEAGRARGLCVDHSVRIEQQPPAHRPGKVARRNVAEFGPGGHDRNGVGAFDRLQRRLGTGHTRLGRGVRRHHRIEDAEAQGARFSISAIDGEFFTEWVFSL